MDFCGRGSLLSAATFFFLRTGLSRGKSKCSRRVFLLVAFGIYYFRVVRAQTTVSISATASHLVPGTLCEVFFAY